MAQRRLELIFDNIIRGQEQLKQMCDTANALLEKTREHGKAAGDAGEAHKRAASTANDSWLKAAAQVAAYSATVKALTIDTATYAARTQTLAVVTDQLARVNNLSVNAVRAQVQAVKAQGITTQESLATVNKMIFAQLDLAKATNLARLSQDAAVIAGINSSEALAGIIHGVTTRQTEVLRTYGIVVTFEQEFTKAARQIGRELTAAEKTQVALNIVLNEGAKITGAYAASMLTAGKQLTSMTRYIDEAKNSIGEGLIPTLGTAVHWMTQLAKYAEQNSEQFSHLAVGITAAGAGLAAFKYMPGPLPLRLGAGAVAAGATWAFGNVDPVQYHRDQAASAIASYRRQQEEVNQQLANPSLRSDEAKALQTRFRALEQYERIAVENTAENLAKIARERGKGVIFGTGREIQNIGDLDVGYGARVTTRDMYRALSRLEGREGSGGALFNQQAFDEAQRRQTQELTAQKIAAAQKKVDQILQGLGEQNLSPLSKLAQDEAEAIRLLKASGASRGQIQTVQAAFAQRSLDLFNASKLPGRDFSWMLPGVSPNDFRAFYKTENVEVNPDVTAGILGGFNQRRLSAIQFTTQYQEQLIRLTSGPTGQVDAVQRIASLRIQSALQEAQITKDRAKLEMDLLDARRERTLALLELERQQMEKYREMAGRSFDALLSGGAGVRTLLLGGVTTIGRTVFQNMTAEVFKAMAGRFTLPGQGTAQNPTFWGKMWSGTPLGMDAAAIKLDVSALKLNAAGDSLIAAAGALAGASGAGGALPSRTFDLIGGTLPTGAGMGGGAGSTADLSSYFSTFGFKSGPGKYAALKKGIGTAAALAAGAYGAYSGFSSGGAQGALTGSASILGTAGVLLPMLSKSLSFMGPVGMIGGLGLGLLASLFGNRRQKRATALEEERQNRAFTEPTGTDYLTDYYGRQVDYSAGGGLRVYKVVNNYTTNNVQAMDAGSFDEFLKRNPTALASGMANAYNSGNAEDALGTLREVL